MKIVLERKHRKETYTIGNLYIDGAFFSNTLEDRDRGLTSDMSLKEIEKIKVMHETAIPYGTYKIGLAWSPKHGRITPRLHSVPGFEGILIHSGNTEADSSGCILLGKNSAVGKVLESKTTVAKFHAILEQAEKDNNLATIEIVKEYNPVK